MARKASGPSFDPNLLLATAGRGRTKLEYRSEGVIFSQGDAADFIFYILRGKIKIFVISKQGREAVVALLGEGDFFGEGCPKPELELSDRVGVAPRLIRANVPPQLARPRKKGEPSTGRIG